MTRGRLGGAAALAAAAADCAARGVRLRAWGQALAHRSDQQIAAIAPPGGEAPGPDELAPEELEWMAQVGGALAGLLADESGSGEPSPPLDIDLGDMLAQSGGSGDPDALAKAALAGRVAGHKPRDLVIFGMGRVGRVLLRLLVEDGPGPWLRPRALAVRGGPGGMAQRLEMLRRDSVHGRLLASVQLLDGGRRLLLGHGMEPVQVVEASAPDQADYAAVPGLDDALVIDSSGVWRDAEGLGRHLASPQVGAALLTVPGKGLPNLVWGVNHAQVGPREPLTTAASCTTNAVVPLLHLIAERFGIHSGHLETVHAYTNDQNLVDNQHKSPRRGRSAVANMVITSTGAASAAAEAVPAIAGRLTGNAVRVPVADVSLAVLALRLEQPAQGVVEYLRAQAATPRWRDIIGVEDSPEAVSSDQIGSRHATVLDAPACIEGGGDDGRQCVIYAWYDNEMGYAAQVLRLAEYLARPAGADG